MKHFVALLRRILVGYRYAPMSVYSHAHLKRAGFMGLHELEWERAQARTLKF